MAGARIQLKRGLAAQWTAANTVLLSGEIGYETDTDKFKIGNGSAVWTSLPYFNGNLTGSNLNDLADVTITSAANGDFLRWNGTAWVNDAVNLSTDTVGDYVGSLVAGTGITLANNSGEGATPTVTVNTSVIQARVANVTDTEIGYLDGVTSAIQTQLDTKSPTSSPTFTGTVTLPDNTVALGTKTSGDYVASLVAGTGVTLTNNSGETATPTVAIGQAVATNSNVTFNDVIVSGNLTVSGSTTSINTEILTVDDNVIVLNNNVTTAPTENAGIEIERGTSPNVVVRWNETTDKWETTNDGTTYGNIVTTADSGTVTSTMITDGTIVNGDINASAAIALSKLASGTSAQVIVADASGVPTYATLTGDVTVSNTGVTTITANSVSLGTDTTGDYVQNLVAGTGVTLTNNTGESATPTVAIGQSIGAGDSPTFTGLTINGASVVFEGATANDFETTLAVTDPTADRTVTFQDGTGTVAFTSDVTTHANLTEAHGATGAVVGTTNTQTLTNKTLTSPKINEDVVLTATATELNVLDGITSSTAELNILDGATLTTTELNYVDGVTSAIQTQMDLKSPLASPTFTGTVTVPDNTIALGTKTTGDYVATITGGTGVSSTAATTGEGTTHTLSIGQAVGTGDNVTFAGVTAALTGNASTATTLQTSRNIAGQAFNGSANISIAPTDLTGVTSTAAELNILDGATLTTTELNYVDGVTSAIQTQIDTKAPAASPTFTGTVTLPDNTVALGTKTTGDYVATITGGTGITSTALTTGEGTTHSLSIGQAVATTDNVTFAGVTADAIRIGVTAAGEIDTASGNLTIDSAGGTVTIDDNLTVTGDLTVSGTTTSINTETLTVDDNIIVLNNNVTGSPTENAGIEVERGTSANVLVRWNETSDKWEATNDGTTYGNIVTSADSGTVTSAMIADGTIVDADVNASAAIAHSKLANATAGQILLGTTTTGVVTATTLSGDVTVTGAGVTAIGSGKVTSSMIVDGTIVDGDINASAGIALSKLATSTAGNIIVYNSAGVPTAVAETGDITISDTGVTAIGSGKVTSTMILDGTIVNGDINASAAIDLSKLASGTSAQVIVANGSGVPTYVTLSGDVTISNTGVATIQANSVALGTDTTGSYVTSLVAGTGITLSNNSGESATPTVAVTANTYDAYGSARNLEIKFLMEVM